MELNKTYTRIGEYNKCRPSETYWQTAAVLGLSFRRGPPKPFDDPEMAPSV